MSTTATATATATDAGVDKFFGIHQKCDVSDIDGNISSGPGVGCYIFICILSLGALFNLGVTVYGASTNSSMETSLRLAQTAMNVFGIYFMYSMCHICRPYTGFLILLALNCVFGVFINILRKSTTKKN